MPKVAVFLFALCGAILVTAQASSHASSADQHRSKKPNEDVTARGCVSRSFGDYVLIQPDVGNSYELQGSRKLRLGPYLGQEVEVTGVESPSMSNSSDTGFGRLGSPSPVTITVHSIKTIAKRCSER